MENDKYIGRLLGGRYELIDVVGVGGMAVVYRARDTILGRYVAIKILKEAFAKDPDIRKRFAIESRAVAKLSHHNIVSVYDVGNEDGTDYIVMELIEGVTLKEYLQQKGRLSWQESIFFAEQISSALVHAHSRGIIHQDIKPQNIIILRDGTAKLTDFGIASFATTQETRVVQEAIGSVHYISPEQAKGSKIDYRTDIYSLGVVMYEMLTGKLPFEGETALQIVMQHINAVPPMPSELVPDIPKGLDAIVMHAMCANISRRYASADELCADLARVREDPNVQFYYTASDDSSGETQVIDRDVQRAARHAAVEDTAAVPTAPRHRSDAQSAERVSARREAPARRRTSVREPSDFFEKLSERPTMAAGMAVAVVAVISLLVVAVLMFTGSGKSAKIDVPDLIGRTIDDVYADSDVMNNFEIKEASSRQESDRPAGEILDQDPGEGQQAVKGSVITVTVSVGGDNVKDTYKVVDFTGKSLDYVAASLDAHGIDLKEEKEYSDDVEEGKVIRTDPEAGTELARGETLTVYISLGKEQKSADVPSLTGMTQEAAQRALSERGLSLGSVDQVESDKPEGTVVWQSIDADSTVNQGTTVNIQISKGKKADEQKPDSSTNGSNTGSSEDDTPGKLPPTPAEGSATIPVALPDSADTAHVVIYVDGVIQYDDTPSTSQGSIAVTVQSTAGDHEVTVSVDGSSTTQTYSFN